MKIKVTDLKKKLNEYSQKDLIALITDLYKTNKDVQSYLSVKFMGNEATEELFEQAKKKIKNEFFPERGLGKLRLAEAKKAITNFEKITGDELKTLDLMLYYVELGVEFTNTYGDIYDAFYSSMETMYEKVTTKCALKEEYYKIFADRLENVVVNTEDIAWGFHDVLADCYYNMGYPDEDEE
jgi:Family of unknown function (DUF6155)